MKEAAAYTATLAVSIAVIAMLVGALLVTNVGNHAIDEAQRMAARFRANKSSSPAPGAIEAIRALAQLVSNK